MTDKTVRRFNRHTGVAVRIAEDKASRLGPEWLKSPPKPKAAAPVAEVATDANTDPEATPDAAADDK